MSKRGRKKRIPKSVAKFFETKDGKLVKKETSIERKIRELLTAMGIQFEQEWRIKYKLWNKVYDFLVYKEDEYQFIIETNGNFFHPAVINEDGSVRFNDVIAKKKKIKLNRMQKKNIQNDILKNRIAKQLGIPIIYLWENVINESPTFCKKIIKDEIKRQKQIYED